MTTLVRPQYTQARLSPGPIAGHPEDRAMVFRPRLGVVGGPAVIYCHGALNDFTQVLENAAYEFVTRLCAIGVTVVAPDLGTGASGPGSLNSWGNSTVAARIEAWRTWMVANLPCDASTVTIMGFSMGGCSSLGYARDYKAKVAAVVNWEPAYDLVAMRADRANPDGFGVFAPLIDAAYGITSTDPLPAGADPYTNATLHNLKWRGYYHADGPVFVPSDWVTRMATWTGGQAIPTYGLTTHTTDTMLDAHTPFDELVSWLGFV